MSGSTDMRIGIDFPSCLWRRYVLTTECPFGFFFRFATFSVGLLQQFSNRTEFGILRRMYGWF